MIIIKGIILLSIFLASSMLGMTLAKKYKDRVYDLKQMKSALNILKTKIEYTYSPLPEIFEEIGSKFERTEFGEIFKNASFRMHEMSAGEAWKQALKVSQTSMKEEDIEVIQNLEKLLGKTNADRTNKSNKFNRRILRNSDKYCRKRKAKKRKTI